MTGSAGHRHLCRSGRDAARDSGARRLGDNQGDAERQHSCLGHLRVLSVEIYPSGSAPDRRGRTRVDRFHIGQSSAGTARPGRSARQALSRHRGALRERAGHPDGRAGGEEGADGAGEAWEHTRDHAAARLPNFEYAEALYQIAIVLGSVAIVAASPWLLGVSGVLAAVGLALTINGYLLLVPLPHGDMAHPEAAASAQEGTATPAAH